MVTTLDRPQTAAERLTPRPPRSRRRRTLVGLLVGLVTLACVLAIPLGFGLLPAVYQPPLPKNAAYAVGRDVVTAEQFDTRQKTIEALYGAQRPADPAGADRYRRDMAKAMVVSTVMANGEAARGIVIPDNRVRDTLTQLVSQRFGPGPDGYKKFTDSLAQVGSSEAKLMDEMRAQMGTAELVNQVTADVKPTPQEVKDAYPRYAMKLGDPEQRRLSVIVVTTPEQANDLANQARSGVPFADLARRFTMEQTTKDAGGDLGLITQDKLQPAFGNPAFSTPKGQVFGPVQTDSGWNVGMVTDIVPGKPAPFEDAQIPLENAVTGEKKMQAWKDWLGQQMIDAHIRYGDDYRPADPTGVPAGLGPQQ